MPLQMSRKKREFLNKWILIYMNILKSEIRSPPYTIHRIQFQVDKREKCKKQKLKTFNRRSRRIYFRPRGMKGFLKQDKNFKLQKNC